MLIKILDNLNSKFVYIQTHNFPDPDSISSAFALQYLLKINGINSKICYKGQIDSVSTMQMVEKLGIELYEMSEVADMKEDDEIILVDAQKGNSNIVDMDGAEVMCIDHHPIFDKVDYKVSDIRPEFGACATILTTYFFENYIPIPKDVATALSYGIKVDTANLTRSVSEKDMEMFYRLHCFSDQELLASLDRNTLKFEDLHAYAAAISSIQVFDFVSFANPGADCPESLIASISDFMLALAEVKFSVVYSQRGKGIKVSVRSELNDYNAGVITNKALKDIGSGGGHAQMAGGFVPIVGSQREITDLMNIIREKFIEVIKDNK